MFSKRNMLNCVVVTFLIASVLSANNPGLIQRNVNGNLLNLIARSGDSNSFLSCFGYYMEQVDIVTKKYEKDYEACCNAADGKRSELNLENVNSRNSLANRTATSCAALQECSEVSAVDEEYECYVYGGGDNAKLFHIISNDASTELANYVENNRIIKMNEDRCTNKTKSTYEYESIALYDDFSDCLLGRVKVPETTTTTPAPSPSPTAAPEPITTTTERN